MARAKWNRIPSSDVVLVMEGGADEVSVEWTAEDGPMTQRCVYVQDRDSKSWSAQALAATVEVEAISSR